MLTPNRIDMIIRFTIKFFGVETDLLRNAYEEFKRDILNQNTGYICAPFPVEVAPEMPILLLLEFKRTDGDAIFFIVSDAEEAEDLMREWQVKISGTYRSYQCKFSHKLLKPGTLGTYLEKAKEIFAPPKSKQFSHIS